MEKDKFVYLRLIFDSTQKIKDFISGMQFEDFVKDPKTQSSVLMQFHVIGELAKKIEGKVKEKISVPWKEISGFRDIISHDYFSIELKEVWDTAVEDTSKLADEINKYLNK